MPSGFARPLSVESVVSRLVLLFPLLAGCAYSVEDWWTDLAQAHCDCQYPDDRRSQCVDEVFEEVWMASPEWDACRDEAAPVERSEMRAWSRRYTENCDELELDPPQPEDPNWAATCGG